MASKIFIGRLKGYKVYQTAEHYEAYDPDGYYLMSGDTSEEVFDELAYIIAEHEGKHIN